MLIKTVDVIPENAVKTAKTICLLLNEFKKKIVYFHVNNHIVQIKEVFHLFNVFHLWNFHQLENIKFSTLKIMFLLTDFVEDQLGKVVVKKISSSQLMKGSVLKFDVLPILSPLTIGAGK